MSTVVLIGYLIIFLQNIRFLSQKIGHDNQLRPFVECILEKVFYLYNIKRRGKGQIFKRTSG